ncbi:MAG TPA: glycogen debranching enzyme GlgX, partial [Chloroflexota bacterium]|nr:glycogen debranching enzyme GlgX [Chloroflexota bacterium]
SWNCGAEGPTNDPEINALRARQQRNFLATLFLSQGVPMLLGGDEIGRTQQGNNNAYCQDNPISWYDWQLDDAQRALLEFTRRLIALRKEHPALRRAEFLTGEFLPAADIKDLTWLKVDGTEMTEAEWRDPHARSLGMRLAGLPPDGAEGDDPAAGTLLVLFNAYHEELPFVLPEAGAESTQWEVLLDTRSAEPPLVDGAPPVYDVGDEYPLAGRSVAVLRRVPPERSAAAAAPPAPPPRRWAPEPAG